ncbi:MAG: hypothetical protein Q8M16_13330 [Pirellulaceae bacterium]|nr:hypothetical protein [Pirellulaceae bacterium]
MSQLCLFSIPKPLQGSTERLQRNAFESWRRLGATVEVVLLGDEHGVAEAAREYGFLHWPQLNRNSLGTPLINHAWTAVRQATTARQFLYANADILFDQNLLTAATILDDWPMNRYLAIGQRIETNLDSEIRDWSDERLRDWIQRQRIERQRASIVCKDYFLFPRHLYLDVPDFAVGRGNWDNWVVYDAHRSGVPVVDLTRQVVALHQPHDHLHSGGRRQAYVVGAEARENQRLAGGRHLLIGSHASHFLDEHGQVVRMGWRWLPRAIQDVPRFIELLRTLVR